jgi:hypothetical protein
VLPICRQTIGFYTENAAGTLLAIELRLCRDYEIQAPEMAVAYAIF